MSFDTIVYGLEPVIHSLIIDDIFAGIGAVLRFIPIIVTLFFFIEHCMGTVAYRHRSG